jgi:DNA-binding transcriptional regulator YdaS (Cro superfamily)
MSRDYPQLDDDALSLLRRHLEIVGGNKAELARKLGIARSSLSQALDRKYPGDTRKLRALIMETLAEQVMCPHLRVELAPAACKALRERPITAVSASRADVKHWQACQGCIENPARRTKEMEVADV